MKTLPFTYLELTILNNIDLESYGIDNNLSKYDKIQELYKIFKAEYLHDYNIKKYKGNEPVIFAEWLQGLPSALTVPFYNYEILEAARLNGVVIEDEEAEDEYLEGYWLKLANAFFTLKDNL